MTTVDKSPPTRPPRFTKWQPPKPIVQFQKQVRTSSQSRGYDSRWTRLSIAFRKRNPFCSECALRGRDEPAYLTGHIIPIQDRPDLRLEWKNLRPLCTRCNTLATEMENFARQTGQTEKLPEWCADISKRPRKFQPIFYFNVG